MAGKIRGYLLQNLPESISSDMKCFFFYLAIKCIINLLMAKLLSFSSAHRPTDSTYSIKLLCRWKPNMSERKFVQFC